MADQVRTIIKKKWFRAEELDEIMEDGEHQNETEDNGTELQDTGSRLESTFFSTCGVCSSW